MKNPLNPQKAFVVLTFYFFNVQTQQVKVICFNTCLN